MSSEKFDILSIGNIGVLQDFIYEDNEDIIPEFNGIYHLDEAVELINKHVKNGSEMVIFADVDCDGMESTYVANKVLESALGRDKVYCSINKERKHGITKQHIENLNKFGVKLLIIVDSSSEAVDIIKEFNGDVVVLDHHEVDLPKEVLKGNTVGGQYVVANNMVSGAEGEDETTRDMSGCMVVYRVMKELVYKYKILGEGGERKFEEMQLEHCVGLTLFTDVIPLRNKRNQHFISKILNNHHLEDGLKRMLGSLDIMFLDKTKINFSLAPIINSAVRCGRSLDALNIIMDTPERLKELKECRELQRQVIEKVMDGSELKYENYVVRDITNENLGEAYNGLLASKLMARHCKCTFVYSKEINEDGRVVCKGSFRGTDPIINYRALFMRHGAIAKGHKSAFGLTIPEYLLHKVMDEVCSTPVESSNNYISYGDAQGGMYHIDDLKEFKRSRNLIHLAHINSRSTGTEEINIVYSGEIELIREEEKYRIYNVGGLECLAFEEIKSNKVSIYVEFCNEVKCYVNNLG